MAVTVEIDREQRLIDITFQGIVTDAALLELEERLRATPDFAAGFNLLNDCSAVSDFRVTATGLYAVAARTQQNTNLTAIVIPARFVHGMARTYEAMANWKTMRVQIFQDRACALEWLISGSTI
jgi:hypothetical protein